MKRPRTAPRLAAAALAGWSALSAAAPGVTAEPRPDAGVSHRMPVEKQRVLEAELRDAAFRMWEASGFGADRSERAAWVVGAPSGVEWRNWPWDRRYEQSRWIGPPPGGAIAIVHTHPAAVDPKPSDTDRATSRRLGISVYVVSRSGIWRADPGGALTRVGDERWWSGCETRKRCRESVSIGIALASAENASSSETAPLPLRITE